MIVSAVTLLPQPDSPTMPRDSPRASEKRHAVDGLDDAVHRLEVRPQVAHVEQHVVGGGGPAGGAAVRRRVRAVLTASSVMRGTSGRSASRRPSPMKLTASTVRTMKRPGKNGHHQLPCGMNVSAFVRMLPQVGVDRVDAEARGSSRTPPR